VEKTEGKQKKSKIFIFDLIQNYDYVWNSLKKIKNKQRAIKEYYHVKYIWQLSHVDTKGALFFTSTSQESLLWLLFTCSYQ